MVSVFSDADKWPTPQLLHNNSLHMITRPIPYMYKIIQVLKTSSISTKKFCLFQTGSSELTRALTVRDPSLSTTTTTTV